MVHTLAALAGEAEGQHGLFTKSLARSQKTDFVTAETRWFQHSSMKVLLKNKTTTTNPNKNPPKLSLFTVLFFFFSVTPLRAISFITD